MTLWPPGFWSDDQTGLPVTKRFMNRAHRFVLKMAGSRMYNRGLKYPGSCPDCHYPWEAHRNEAGEFLDECPTGPVKLQTSSMYGKFSPDPVREAGTHRSRGPAARHTTAEDLNKERDNLLAIDFQQNPQDKITHVLVPFNMNAVYGKMMTSNGVKPAPLDDNTYRPLLMSYKDGNPVGAIYFAGPMTVHGAFYSGDGEPLEMHPTRKYDLVSKYPRSITTTPRSVRTCFSECRGLDFIRANGNRICEKCEKPYSKHPWCIGSAIPESMGSSSFPEYNLNVLCDGRHVKL